MDIRNQRALKNTAAGRLSEASYSPKKLALLHTGIALGVSLLISLINYLLNQQIGTTSGLSGIGSRTILATIQSVLQYASSIALPFWELGFVYAVIRMARSQSATPASLPEGFRRFGPALRLMLLQGILYTAIAMICINLSSFIFTATPFARPLQEKLMSAAGDASTTEAILEVMEEFFAELSLEELLQMLLPTLVIFVILYAIVTIPLTYRFRMADFVIMDEPKTGAFAALRSSSRMMRHNCFKLFRLDLSFWWYYALLALAAVICNGDTLLAYLGVALPISSDSAWFLFYIVGILVQLAVYWQTESYVQTTYAVAYDILRQQEPYEPVPKQPPKKLPWDEYNPQ